MNPFTPSGVSILPTQTRQFYKEKSLKTTAQSTHVGQCPLSSSFPRYQPLPELIDHIATCRHWHSPHGSTGEHGLCDAFRGL